MSGIDLRVKKLLKDDKNIIISAIDHVVMYGDQEGIADSRSAIKNCMSTDALLVSKYTLKRNWDLFAEETSPASVMRLNWSSAFYYPLDYRKSYTTIAINVEEAVQEGAEHIIFSLFLEGNDEETETNNVNIFTEIVRQKEKFGIPLIGECYVVEHKDLTDEQLHLKVKRVCRVMAELGADMIKAFYTKDFEKIVNNTPVPIFTIGAEKLDSDLKVLEKAYNSVNSGARGIVFGRNIFMANDPKAIIAALNDVMNNNIKPKDVVNKYNLV